MKLLDLYKNQQYWDLPYQLLQERRPEESISHREMPSWKDHCEFVRSKPYVYWYVIMDKVAVGCVYLTYQNEIGIGILKEQRRKGYAKLAIYELMQQHPGNFLANINPANEASIRLFQAFGFRHLQNTYLKELT